MMGRRLCAVRSWWLVAVLSLLLAACGSRVDLFGSMAADDANEVLAALLKAGIPADKQTGKEGVSIRVPDDKVGQALQILRENGLPRERFDGMGQIFKKEGLISSPLEERARYIYALSQELSDTLSKIDGVLYAKVHVVLPERGTAGDSGTPATAAVFIKHQDGVSLELLQPQIRRLVTNSIPGLTGERVSIVLVSGLPVEAAAQQEPTVSFLGSSIRAGSLAVGMWIVCTLLVLCMLALSWLVWRYAWPDLKARAQRQTQGDAKA